MKHPIRYDWLALENVLNLIALTIEFAFEIASGYPAAQLCTTYDK